MPSPNKNEMSENEHMDKHKKKGKNNMPSPNKNEMSENEQMYLVTIAMLQEQGHESPVALSELANALSVLPVSVNQMVHKMETSGLVKYYPYKGVEFSPSGREAHFALSPLMGGLSGQGFEHVSGGC